MLSEKMKGKRRVLEPEPITPASSSSRAGPEQEIKNSKRDLVIRFTEGAPDLTVQVEQEDSVKDIKTNVSIRVVWSEFFCRLNTLYGPTDSNSQTLFFLKIRGARPDLADRRLRLIHAGRILPDTTYVYDWLYSLEERQKRATGYKEDSTAPAPHQHHGTVIWMHCSVGPKLEPGEESQEERQQVCLVCSCLYCASLGPYQPCCVCIPSIGLSTLKTAQLQPARGFDRLAAVGFSEEDIANFRRQFHSQSSSNYLDIDFDTEEECMSGIYHAGLFYTHNLHHLLHRWWACASSRRAVDRLSW